MPRVYRNHPALDTIVNDEPNPRQVPLCPRPVAMLTGKARAFDSYGGVTAALKRAIRWQPLAEAEDRSVGMPVSGSATRGSTKSLGSEGSGSFAVSIRRCKRDNSRHLHRRGLPTYTLEILDLIPCRSGKSEVDGSAPPFCLPDRHGDGGATYVCATPPGGGSLPSQ